MSVLDGRVARRDRNARQRLLPELRAVQQRDGWISEGAASDISRRLGIPLADVYGVASFYKLLALEERPREALHVCTDVVCALHGAQVPEGAHASPCLGLCERAPAALRTVAGDDPFDEQLPVGGNAVRHAGPLLRRIAEGTSDRSFALLEHARGLGPGEVRRLVTESGLLGRGGAAFPTGAKWDAVAAEHATPHYLVCNADESEPGTFKDRVLLESDPFGLVEAMAIAAFATGCERGFVYLRGEYALARERLEEAIAECPFPIELRIGAGAYVCGEETALFRSIEGYRGEPRSKPPFPTHHGLHGKPTVVNNVETLFNVREILDGGGATTRLYCVSGHVERPGVYELPLGTTLGELLDRAGARAPKAVLLGGVSGVFVRPDELDRPVEGTGVVIVFGEDADVRAAVRRIAEFFRDESCGQCVPCRIGTVRQVEALQRGDRTALDDLAQAMTDASICGLGQTAARAVQSALELGWS